MFVKIYSIHTVNGTFNVITVVCCATLADNSYLKPTTPPIVKRTKPWDVMVVYLKMLQ